MILQRDSQTSERTIGRLETDDGQVVCFTMELSWRDNAHGDWQTGSCIPAGTYPALRFTSPHIGYELFQLANVPDRVGIDIHKGNTVRDSEGCILLGTTRGTLNGMDAVLDSKDAFDAFMASQAGVDRFTLTVVDVS